jgi:hypothetical protein
MKWFLGLLVVWLAFDAFLVKPRDAARAQRKVVRVASLEERWPQLPLRKEPAKSRRSYSSMAGVQLAHSGR